MKVIKDISYTKMGHVEQKLDLYVPDSEEFSVFVYFHGGGLRGGDKCGKNGNAMALEMIENNIAFVTANYRMYPEASYPDFIKDAAAVVAWTFKHIGEYGKCYKIYVGGTSAGGYLSQMLCFDKRWLAPFGIKPEEIAGYIHDAGQPTVHFNVMRERGFSQKKVAIDEASPIYHIGDADEYAPMLFLISTNDMANRYEQTMLLLGTLKHMDYDMSKVEMQVLEGTHSKYKDYTLAGLVSSYIKKLENK